jgi:predicted Fe-Mo cluster-binding NifX family protein
LPTRASQWHKDCSKNKAKGGTNRLRVAFAVWNDRIAPVFDVARQVLLKDVESGRVVSEDAIYYLREGTLAGKAIWLATQGVDVLVCGAISRPLQAMVAGYGIRVIPFVAGDLHEITRAWLAGTLESGLFAMPGCCRRKRRRRFEGHGAFERTESFVDVGKRGTGGPRGRQRHGRVGRNPQGSG